MTLLVSLPDEELAGAVGPVAGVEYVVGQVPPERAAEVEVFVAPYLTDTSAVADLHRLPRLRLVQLQSAGFDGVPELVPPGVVLPDAAPVVGVRQADP